MASKIIKYTATQLKNLFKNLKSATAIDKKVDSLIAKDSVKNSDSQIIAAGNAASKSLDGPKPIFRAERKVTKKVIDELKKQDDVVKASDKAKKAGETPKAAPVEEGRRPRSPAVDKPKTAKPDSRVADAGSFLTSAQMARIEKAPTPQALTTLQKEITAEINKLKKATDTEKASRLKKLRAEVAGQKQKLRDADAKARARSKKPDNRDAAKKPQSAEERARAGFGKTLTPRKPPQNDKKPDIGGMTSYTSMERGAAIAKAGRELRAGKITKERHKEILNAINRKNASEVDVKSRNIAQKNTDRAGFKGYTPKSPFNKGGLTQPSASQKGLKKLPTTVRNKMGYMNRGGSAKSGSTDMRKGGMFY